MKGGRTFRCANVFGIAATFGFHPHPNNCMNNQTCSRISTPSVSTAPSFPLRHPRSLIPPCLAASAAALVFYIAPSANAETWNLPAGGTWNAGASWNPATIPNGIGASATFNDAASGSNPAQTGNRAVTVDGAKTVGSIIFNNDAANAFTNAVNIGAAGALIFDETGAGPATILVNSIAGATGNNTILAPMTLTDSLLATVNNVTATSGAGALNLTATIAGPGGFTKAGNGMATFGTGTKTYTGATVLNGGRMRVSLLASPTATSSFTINFGAQLDLISAGSYTFGSGPLNLNGTGLGVGSVPGNFPGAIRNDTNLAVTITNQVILQSNTLLHVQGSTTGLLTFPNGVSGPGSLTLTAPGSDANQGQLVLNGSNSYAGGTFVNGGTLVIGGASATLGSGNVTVDDLLSVASIAKLTIQSGVLDAIADTASLTLAGGGIAAVADENFVELQSGINEIVAALMLGGVAQGPGTYGSTLSSATFQNDEYFSGTGIVTVVPEPGALPMMMGSLVLLLSLRRRKAV